jgi:adenosylhomocysteine nucleosidase
MNKLILIALEQEAPHMANWPNVFFTGVGKVNAAITAATLIEKYNPDMVINFGTAGGITLDKGIHEIKNFIQRDMKCCELGCEIGQTPFEDCTFISTSGSTSLMMLEGYTCSTGDNFVNGPQDNPVLSDVVDMEAYAIAKACQKENVTFKCFKYISDNADENANEDWSKTVADGEKHYMRIYERL